MTNFHCCLFAHGFPIEMVCSKDTRLQQQSRRHSPIKWPFGSFCGRTRRRKSARIRPKGTDKYQVGKLFHDPGRMHNVDSKVSQLSIRGDKHALARFSESENFEHSFYVALHVEKHVLIAKQIAQWRRDFTTLRGREPTYEDMPEKLRRLECARICLGQRCVCHNITSALCRHNHSFKSSQDFCIQLESITCDMLRHIPGYCMVSKAEKQRTIRSNNLIIIYDYDSNRYFVHSPIIYLFIHHHKYIRHIRHIRNKDLFINSLNDGTVPLFAKMSLFTSVVIVTVSSKDHGKYIPSNE